MANDSAHAVPWSCLLQEVEVVDLLDDPDRRVDPLAVNDEVNDSAHAVQVWAAWAGPGLVASWDSDEEAGSDHGSPAQLGHPCPWPDQEVHPVWSRL